MPLLRRCTYDRIAPGGWARLRWSPLSEDHPLQTYVGYNFHWLAIRSYESSLLSTQMPHGLSGGRLGQLVFGVLLDTRDDENDPTRGGTEEISLRVSSPQTLAQYTFAGVTLSERRFFPLWRDRLGFAVRLTADFQFGDVPFFEWSSLGGLQTPEGIGGMSSVRGVPRDRYLGNVKALGNFELRFYAYDFALFGQTTKVGGLAFADVGRVWHPNTPDGPWYAWHPGVGGGLRITRRAAVVRLDYAVAPESLRQGIYITFGQLF